MFSNAPTARYRAGVRIGNWFEDICLEHEKLEAFKILRDRGQLLVEKTRLLFDNFHIDVELEAPKEHLRFGAVVQLIPAHLNVCELSGSNSRGALSVIITEQVVQHSQRLNENCELSIAPSLKPCVRNAFRIVSTDCYRDHTDEILKYGQSFALECVENAPDPLLIYCAPKAANLTSIIPSSNFISKHGEINLPLGLCCRSSEKFGNQIPRAYTHWFCKHLDPKMRFETEGQPVPSNKPLVITHFATNKNLAAGNVAIPTLFGPEFLVSCQNYHDIFKRECWQNVWMICNGIQMKKN